MNARRGTPRTRWGDEVVIHCPKDSCGRRLARVRALRGPDGQVLLLQDLEKPDLIKPDPSDESPTGLLPLKGGELAVFRAEDTGSRLPGQPGPLSGYHEAQAPYTAPGDRMPTFGRSPDPWRWSCPCGARPRISNDRLLGLVSAALARGEHHVTLPG